jgi:hypothetical protein
MSGSASGEGEQNYTERFHVEVMSVGIVEVEWEMRRTFSHLARALGLISSRTGPM